jgi:hypothetical protein
VYRGLQLGMVGQNQDGATMSGEVIEVCIRQPVRRPAHKGGGVAIHSLMALRDELKVPPTATLRVCDRSGEWVSLGPASR